MTILETLKIKIKKLSRHELAEFRCWFNAYDAQIEKDTTIGEFDVLAAEYEVNKANKVDLILEKLWIEEAERRIDAFDTGDIEAISIEEALDKVSSTLI